MIGHLGNRLLGRQVAEVHDDLVDQPDLGGLVADMSFHQSGGEHTGPRAAPCR